MRLRLSSRLLLCRELVQLYKQVQAEERQEKEPDEETDNSSIADAPSPSGKQKALDTGADAAGSGACGGSSVAGVTSGPGRGGNLRGLGLNQDNGWLVSRGRGMESRLGVCDDRRGSHNLSGLVGRSRLDWRGMDVGLRSLCD
jgi:hypothetical protein